MNNYTNRVWTHEEIEKRLKQLDKRLSQNPFDAVANSEYKYLDQLRYIDRDEDVE